MSATLSLAALLAALAAAPAAPERVEEGYFLISFRGRTIGKAVRRLTGKVESGRKRLHLVVVEHYRFSTGGRPAARNSLRRAATMRPDWSPMTIEESSTAGGRTRKTGVEILPGKAIFTLAGGKKREVPYKGALITEMNGRALAARGQLKVGGKLTAAVPDLAQGGLVLLRAEVVGAKKVEGHKGRLFLVEVHNAEGQLAWSQLVDEGGRLLEQEADGMLRKRVRKELAVLPNRPEALSAGVVHLEDAPKRFYKLERLVIELALPEITRGLVPEIAGQKAIESGRKVTVKLVARRPDGRLPKEELAGAARKKWLTSESEPDWRDPQIRNCASTSGPSTTRAGAGCRWTRPSAATGCRPAT